MGWHHTPATRRREKCLNAFIAEKRERDSIKGLCRPAKRAHFTKNALKKKGGFMPKNCPECKKKQSMHLTIAEHPTLMGKRPLPTWSCEQCGFQIAKTEIGLKIR